MINYENAYNTTEYDNLIKKYVNEGYKVTSNNNQRTLLIKRNYGRLRTHILILIFTGLFLIGIPNIAYLIYSYYRKRNDVMIFLVGENQYQSNTNNYQYQENTNNNQYRKNTNNNYQASAQQVQPTLDYNDPTIKTPNEGNKQEQRHKPSREPPRNTSYKYKHEDKQVKYNHIRDIKEFLNDESIGSNDGSDPEIIVDYLEQKE